MTTVITGGHLVDALMMKDDPVMADRRAGSGSSGR
jgi:hypothetical protein